MVVGSVVVVVPVVAVVVVVVVPDRSVEVVPVMMPVVVDSRRAFAEPQTITKIISRAARKTLVICSPGIVRRYVDDVTLFTRDNHWPKPPG